MALTVKTLYDGQLGNTSKGMLYTVPSGKATIVKSIRVVNTDTTARTANLYYLKFNNATTLARLITPSSVTVGAGNLLLDDTELTLGAGDQVLGDGSVASKLDCVISGIERDA